MRLSSSDIVITGWAIALLLPLFFTVADPAEGEPEEAALADMRVIPTPYYRPDNYNQCWANANRSTISQMAIRRMSNKLKSEGMSWFKNPRVILIADYQGGLRGLMGWYDGLADQYAAAFSEFNQNQPSSTPVYVLFSFGENQQNKIYGIFRYSAKEEMRSDSFEKRKYCTYEIDWWGEFSQERLDRIIDEIEEASGEGS